MFTSIDQVRYCHVIALRIHFMINILALEAAKAADIVSKDESGKAYHAIFKDFIIKAKPIFSKIEEMNNWRAVAYVDTPFEEDTMFIEYKEKIKKVIVPLCAELCNQPDPEKCDFFIKLKAQLEGL